ncbi:MAG: hypothetical protein IJH12_06070 [Clostridia bacterium]|nr:hypothetical protein [Clostridia bacterium]
MRIIKCEIDKILKKELQKSYKYFIKECNNNERSKGYGLIRDKSHYDKEIASVASVGFGLAALVVGVEHKWIGYEKAYNKAVKTLDTFINNVDGINGFFYHFVDMETGKRAWNCELSIIDTAIFICGALTAGEYFGKKIKVKAELLYKNINWNWYTNKKTNYFYMGYKPEKGFWEKWDMYAEQLMLYILGAGSTTHKINKDMYYEFKRKKADYKDIKDIIYTYGGTLFTYQYSHAWIDFRNLIDEDGINWFENSIKAIKANRQYCIDNKDRFKTFSENSWGLTSCIGPKGYCCFGALPCDADLNIENDGTIATYGAVGSIVFLPEESLNAIKNYYNNLPKLWGKYGFKDGFNFENKKAWYSKEYIGVDKGIEMIMIENYLNGTIWKYFMKNKFVKIGLRNIGLNKMNQYALE